MFKSREEIRALCEKLGPTRVKEILSDKTPTMGMNLAFFGSEHIAEVWLKEIEAKQAEDLKLKELNIAKEANDISKDSNKIAKEAKNKATAANYIALGALFFTLLNFIYLLFFKK